MGERRKEKRRRRHRSSSSSSSSSASSDSRHRRSRRRRRSRSPPCSPPHSSSTAAVAASSSTGDEIVLSIEETNKLRAKLGLKPLEIDNSSSKDKGDASTKSKEFVHAPAKNVTEEKRSKLVRERMETARRKRELRKKLSSIKALGDSDSEDESAASWVNKSKKMEREKILAEQRAEELSKLDEEFEIGRILEEERAKEAQRRYTSRDLSGLRVEHSVDRFREGTSTVLVMKDQSVLDGDDDGDDVLMNVNLADDERDEKNVMNRKQIGSVYNPYADDEWDEHGNYKAKSMLKKYDEVIDGVKKESFVLGRQGGAVAASNVRPSAPNGTDVTSKSHISLTDYEVKPASDFYSQSELAGKFKKRKRKVKKVKMLTADDLLPDEPEFEDKFEPIKKEDEDNFDREIPMSTDDILRSVDNEPDEALDDLQEMLQKARKAKQRMEMSERLAKPEEYLSRVVQPSRKNGSSDDDDDDDGGLHLTRDNRYTSDGQLVLNSTAEFCRSVGDIDYFRRQQQSLELAQEQESMALGAVNNEIMEEDDDEDMDDVESHRDIYGRKRRSGAWQEVSSSPQPAPDDLDAPRPRNTSEDTANYVSVLDNEPMLAKGGLAAALNLASRKGYLEKEKASNAGAGKLVGLQAKHKVREEMRYDDIDAKFNKREQRYMGGSLSDFKELRHYRPDIKLEYVDDTTGRELGPKDAFDIISHRFHGKGSGKKKTEKKLKKVKEEVLMKSMGSSDTPLGTAEKLHNKLERHGQAFLILSGKAAGTSIQNPKSK